MPGRFLADLTWKEAEEAFGRGIVAVLPIGAGCKEHGLHMPLCTDAILASYLTERVVAGADVLAAPPLQYGYYPAFTEYPGSISVGKELFRGLLIDICRSLHSHGARAIYVLNTGISTNWALEPARLALAKAGVLMDFTDLTAGLAEIEKGIAEQKLGTHADEIETSMMLHIAPERVRLELAVPELSPKRGSGRSYLTRNPAAESGIFSPSGAWGDPTLATPEKGRLVMEAFVELLLREIREISAPGFRPKPARDSYL